MANKIQAQVVGGAIKSFDGVETVGEVREKMNLGANYTVTVNGEAQDNDYELSDYEFVAFAPSVKGA